MEIEINSEALLDSPYSKFNKDLFVFDESQVEHLVNEITFGSPTCYLISGYRGVGKTSLINRVQATIEELMLKSKSAAVEQLLFVKSSFAGQESNIHIIRKLIRALYLSTAESPFYQKIDSDSGREFKATLNVLHQRTFKEISEISDDISNTESKLSVVLSTEVLKKIGKSALPIVALPIWYATKLFGWDFTWIWEWIVPIGLLVWAIANIASVQLSIVHKKQTMRSNYVKTLFDDEIAGTHFSEALKKLKDLRFKIVFVLDELDKVDSDGVDLIIKELKPYMIGGHASFIIVGGQEFFYKFHSEENMDDSILSSLFSKVFHVPLTSSPALKNLFLKSIVNKRSLETQSTEDRLKLEILLSYLILKSRLVPRRFIKVIRQSIIWKDGRAILHDGLLPEQSGLYASIISTIDKLDDNKLSSELSAPIRDFVVMKMYINTYSILISRNRTIDKESFIKGQNAYEPI